MTTAGENYLLNKQIKNYMLANYKDHIDLNGYLCMTTLAEDCSIALHDEAADDIHFEIAYEVGTELDLLGE